MIEPKASKRQWTKLGIVLSIVASLGLAIWWYVSVLDMQMTTSIWVQRCARQLREAKEKSGQFPETVTCRDYWGRSLLYFHSGEKFVLVSLGRDGKQDAAEGYGLLVRDESLADRRSTCFNPDADTIVVDGKSVQVCLK